MIGEAVATFGVSDRIAFLRRTYALLGVALLAWAAITAGMMRFMSEASLKFSAWAFNGRWNWLLVIVLFMVIGYAAERLARSNASQGVQYAGLALFVVAQSLILQPLLWFVIARFGGSSTDTFALIGQAAAITIAIFVGLTATVFITRKDFSFLRGALTVGVFAALGVIVASLAFGFSLGALFCGAMILLMTTLAMRRGPASARPARRSSLEMPRSS